MKRLLFSASLILAVSAAGAQNIKDILKSSPSSVFKSIDALNRTQMCELKEKGVDDGVMTIFGDTVTVERMSNDFISFRHSNTEVQIKLMDDVIAVSETFGSDIQNSELSIFDKDWNLKWSWIYGSKQCKKMPDDLEVFEDLVVKPEDMNIEEFNRLKLYFDPLLVKVELSADSNEITLTPFCPLLSEEEKVQIKPLLKQKTLKWTSGKFK